MSQTFTSNDFTDIMDSLVLFMKNQAEFSDMNFDGSAIRELLRVLAYNAQQQAFQNNFVYNELQLDSAQLRQNVTSIASRLGYVPSSKTASRMKVNLTVTPSYLPSASPTLVITKDTQFYATKDGQTYILSPDTEYVANLSSAGTYLFNNVTLLQGTWALNGFLVQTQYGTESYVVPNIGVDVNTLEVAVRDSESSGAQVLYSQFKTAYDLDPLALLYFLRENRDGLFEFKFGDNKFSKRLTYGNVVTVRYLVTDGSLGNDLSNISPAGAIGGYYDININQIDARTYGGADQEDIESIRTLAPISFATSSNAVTGGDYVGLTKKLFVETLDAISWGGEANTPPRYGYVFVSVIPKHSESLSISQKSALSAILKQYNVGSVTPIIVDPEYTYINVDSTIKFKPTALNISTSALVVKVSDYFRIFSKDKMERFSGSLDISKFSEFINNIDLCVQGNSTRVSYEKRLVPPINVSSSYIVDFSHSIAPGSVNITGFKISDADFSGWTYHMIDVSGVLVISKTKTDGTTKILINNAGHVDYIKGVVSINGFTPNLLTDLYIKIKCSSPMTDDQSLVGVKNSILKINDINVTLLAVDK
jgi:hypothetical protein